MAYGGMLQNLDSTHHQLDPDLDYENIGVVREIYPYQDPNPLADLLVDDDDEEAEDIELDGESDNLYNPHGMALDDPSDPQLLLHGRHDGQHLAPHIDPNHPQYQQYQLAQQQLTQQQLVQHQQAAMEPLISVTDGAPVFLCVTRMNTLVDIEYRLRRRGLRRPLHAGPRTGRRCLHSLPVAIEELSEAREEDIKSRVRVWWSQMVGATCQCPGPSLQIVTMYFCIRSCEGLSFYFRKAIQTAKRTTWFRFT